MRILGVPLLAIALATTAKAEDEQVACANFCADLDTEFQLQYQVTCDCTPNGGAKEEADCDVCVYAIAGDDSNRYCYQYSYEVVFDAIDPINATQTQSKLCYRTTEQPGQRRASGGPLVCETWSRDDDTDISLTINGKLCPRRFASFINCEIPYLYDCSDFVAFADSINLCNGDGVSGYLEGWWQLEYGPAPQRPGSCGPLPDTNSNKSDGLSTGAIVGLVVGVLAVVGTVTAVALYSCKRPNSSDPKKLSNQRDPPSPMVVPQAAPPVKGEGPTNNEEQGADL